MSLIWTLTLNLVWCVLSLSRRNAQKKKNGERDIRKHTKEKKQVLAGLVNLGRNFNSIQQFHHRNVDVFMAKIL